MRGNKKQSKVNQQARHRAVEACNDAAIREPPPKTWAARKPAYAYTPLCPDQELREAPEGVIRARRRSG